MIVETRSCDPSSLLKFDFSRVQGIPSSWNSHWSENVLSRGADATTYCIPLQLQWQIATGQLDNPLMRGRLSWQHQQSQQCLNFQPLESQSCLRLLQHQIPNANWHTPPPHIFPQRIAVGTNPSLLQMLELAVAEIQHQDEQVWTMKQDEHNRPGLPGCPPAGLDCDPISLWDWVFETGVVGRQIDSRYSN